MMLFFNNSNNITFNIDPFNQLEIMNKILKNIKNLCIIWLVFWNWIQKILLIFGFWLLSETVTENLKLLNREADIFWWHLNVNQKIFMLYMDLQIVTEVLINKRILLSTGIKYLKLIQAIKLYLHELEMPIEH